MKYNMVLVFVFLIAAGIAGALFTKDYIVPVVEYITTKIFGNFNGLLYLK